MNIELGLHELTVQRIYECCNILTCTLLKNYRFIICESNNKYSFSCELYTPRHKMNSNFIERKQGFSSYLLALNYAQNFANDLISERLKYQNNLD